MSGSTTTLVNPAATTAAPTPANKAASSPGVVLSFGRFSQSVKLGDKDHIFLGPLRVLHGKEKHTRADWQKLIEQLKTRPVKRV